MQHVSSNMRLYNQCKLTFVYPDWPKCTCTLSLGRNLADLMWTPDDGAIDTLTPCAASYHGCIINGLSGNMDWQDKHCCIPRKLNKKFWHMHQVCNIYWTEWVLSLGLVGVWVTKNRENLAYYNKKVACRYFNCPLQLMKMSWWISVEAVLVAIWNIFYSFCFNLKCKQMHTQWSENASLCVIGVTNIWVLITLIMHIYVYISAYTSLEFQYLKHLMST